MNRSSLRSALRILTPARGGGGGRCGSGERFGGVLYIYNPHHDEAVTIDETLRIDPLVGVSETDTLVVETVSSEGGRTARIETPFRKSYVLGDIIPERLWPDASRSERRVQIKLSVESERGRYLSQPTHAIVLVHEQPPGPEPRERRYCQVPWKRGRLGGRNAAPCRRLVRKFHVPSHDAAEDYDPWNSDTMIALRESLVQGRNKYCFHGCPNCATAAPREMHGAFSGDPLIRENIELARREYLEGRTRLKSKPIVLVLKMGTACDNKCTFCSIHETRSPFAIFGRTLDLANECFPYARQVIFTGGEPLVLSKYIRRIIAGHAPQEGKEIRFNTNGVLVKDRLDLLGGFSNLTLSISLNTSCPDTYRRLHGTDGFHKVLEGVRQIRQARPGLETAVHLKMLVMRCTYRQIRDFSRLAADLGVDAVLFRHLRWYKRLAIDVNEKLMPGDPARAEASAAVDEAREFLAPMGVKVPAFLLDARADDVT